MGKHDHSDSSSSSDDESSRRHKSKKHKKEKRHKHDSHHEDAPPAGIKKITEDDFFAKNAEFCYWLKEKKDTTFERLDSKHQRKLFAKFVDKWNRGELSKRFYETPEEKAPVRTDYKWGFVKDLAAEDRSALGAVVADTRASTDHAVDDDGTVIGPLPPGMDAVDREDAAEAAAAAQRRERKAYRKHNEAVLEELVPKETGRDARIDKRRVAAQDRSAREDSPEPNADKLMYASTDFGAELQRRRENNARKLLERKEQAMEKIAAYQEKCVRLSEFTHSLNHSPTPTQTGSGSRWQSLWLWPGHAPTSTHSGNPLPEHTQGVCVCVWHAPGWHGLTSSHALSWHITPLQRDSHCRLGHTDDDSAINQCLWHPNPCPSLAATLLFSSLPLCTNVSCLTNVPQRSFSVHPLLKICCVAGSHTLACKF
eukprot:m.135542 g.135542  ORF g.135542 m.135542 type:complete len:425 (-) comp14872_c3_seq2:138-1412(-)